VHTVKVPPAPLAERLWEVSDQVLAPGQDVRIDDLAELVGVPRATLYYYFSGKDDLVAFLLTQKLQRGTDAVAAAAHSSGNAVERLPAVLRAMLHTMADHPELCTRLLGAMISQGTVGELMVEIERTLMAPVRNLLAEAKAAGQLVLDNPADTTLALMGAVAIVSMVRTATNTFDPDEIARWLIPQLLEGLYPRT
jgi:TetR/AcrR family transcriptional regulator